MKTNNQEMLMLATTALRDLYAGYPEGEIAAREGSGLRALVRELVEHQRGQGIDDEKGWDCDVTEDIPVDPAPMLPYTVVLLYPLCGDEQAQTFTGTVEAVSAPDAAVRAKQAACEDNWGDFEPEDFSVVAIFEGDLDPLWG